MQFNLTFRDQEDARIIEHLNDQVNKTEYIRQLIRADMANRSYTDALIRQVREEMLHAGELEMKNAELRKELNRWQNGLKR